MLSQTISRASTSKRFAEQKHETGNSQAQIMPGHPPPLPAPQQSPELEREQNVTLNEQSTLMKNSS